MAAASDILTILGLALLASAGNVLGSIGAEWKRVPPKVVGSVLHAAAGVAIAVVSVELMPRILDRLPASTMAVAFIAGAAVSLLMAKAARRAARALELRRAGPLMVAFAVAIDLFSDGLMVGVGASVSQKLGLLLALGQVVANVPGGFATTSNLRTKGARRTVRLLVALGTGTAALAGGLLGFMLLRDSGETLKSAALAFIVGLLLLATVEDIVPEGDEPRAGRVSTTASFTSGFVAFALLSIYAG